MHPFEAGQLSSLLPDVTIVNDASTALSWKTYQSCVIHTGKTDLPETEAIPCALQAKGD